MSCPTRRFWSISAWGLLFAVVLLLPAMAADEADRGDAADSPAGSAGDSLAGGEPSATPSDRAMEADGPSPSTTDQGANPEEEKLSIATSFSILAIGMVIVLGLIIALKVNAFIALITAAIVVSLLSVALLGQGTWFDSITRVATEFGSKAGSIGIVIALAAIIGKCMLDSGAADRIVRSFLSVLGEKRASVALTGSGFVLAIPVFFDTVFYLLVPLARSLFQRTKRNYLLYVLAIATGGAITHTLVPPTPGPLVMATTLGFDVGIMILVGGAIALPAAIAGLVFSHLANRWMPIPMRRIGDRPEPPALADSQLPSLWLSVLPVILPVLMISANTIVSTMAKTSIHAELEAAGAVEITDSQLKESMRQPERLADPATRRLAEWAGITNVFGNANFALLVSTVIAVGTLIRQRKLTRTETASVVEAALMSGGVIILITASGGAFGEMLKVAQVGEAIQQSFASVGASSGLMMLLLGFGLASLLKIAQGSSTAAMIIGSSMLAGIAQPETLGFHPVYLACAIGGGSLVGSWMNDSGFWIFAKMSGLTEVEALKSWTPLLIVLGTVALIATAAMATVLPLTGN